MSLLLLTVTLRGVSNKHCLLPLFSFLCQFSFYIRNGISSFVCLSKPRLSSLRHIGNMFLLGDDHSYDSFSATMYMSNPLKSGQTRH